VQLDLASSLEKIISMHSDISKKDHEHSKNFPIIMVLYNPYNREKEYKGLNRTVTPVIYLKLQTIGVITDKYGLGTTPTQYLPLTHRSNE